VRAGGVAEKADASPSSPPLAVIPAQAGIQCRLTLGSRLRGNDGGECEVGWEFGVFSKLAP